MIETIRDILASHNSTIEDIINDHTLYIGNMHNRDLINSECIELNKALPDDVVAYIKYNNDLYHLYITF